MVFKCVLSELILESAMRNWEYHFNGRVNNRGLSTNPDQYEIEEYLKNAGLPDTGITYVLRNPNVLPILGRAICMTRANPRLSLKEAFMKCVGIEEKSDESYADDGLLPCGIRTWGDFVPVKLHEGKVEIPFSGLPENYRRQVECCVLGQHRDRISSGNHHHEHAISYERE